jgi:hypothetical protein
VVHQILHY